MRKRAENIAMLAPVRAGKNKAVLGQPFHELVFDLQTTLDVGSQLEAFSAHLAGSVPHDGWAYRHPQGELVLAEGRGQLHSCSYQLQLEEFDLGLWQATRAFPFSAAELATIEAFLCRLVYPLRNGLMYRQALLSAYLDPLTKTRNRAALAASLQREWELARRHGQPLSAIMLDVDHSKAINDHYGHAAGDAVLAQVAASIGQSMRGSDLVFRYGGEEFLILLASTDESGALQMAERMRSALEQHDFRSPEGESLRVTASLGVSALDVDDSKEDLVARADRGLYRAKREGRNRVRLALD
jgi:diguanylate cyclase (GGDEF)-like protein